MGKLVTLIISQQIDLSQLKFSKNDIKKLELDPKKYIKNVKDRVGKDDKYF